MFVFVCKDCFLSDKSWEKKLIKTKQRKKGKSEFQSTSEKKRQDDLVTALSQEVGSQPPEGTPLAIDILSNLLSVWVVEQDGFNWNITL